MVSPASEAALAEALAGARGPFVVRGGGTRAIGAAEAGEVLETGALSGIRLYEPGALTLVAGAGTTLAGIEAALAAEGQRMAFEPPDMRAVLGRAGEPTIGGVVAANASGPRRVQAGACRDFLLGMRAVTGRGEIVRAGGRVMKNVTGYDLARLFCGARGTLGVISEVALKVLPAPETEATLLIEGLDAADGVAALCRAMGTTLEVSGAAHLPPEADGGPARTVMRLEGSAASVGERARRLAGMVPGGGRLLERGESAALWRGVRDVRPFAGREGALWHVSVKPTDGPVLSGALAAEGLAFEAMYDWSGGRVWLLTEAGGDGGAAMIRARVAALGGHATLMRGPGDVPAFHPEPEAVARLSAGLRAAFDPNGILNRGLMG